MAQDPHPKTEVKHKWIFETTTWLPESSGRLLKFEPQETTKNRPFGAEIWHPWRVLGNSNYIPGGFFSCLKFLCFEHHFFVVAQWSFNEKKSVEFWDEKPDKLITSNLPNFEGHKRLVSFGGDSHFKWATARKPVIDIPWNPGWLIGILILAYENPYITG